MSPTAAYPETVDRAFPASTEGGESVAGWNCVIKGPARRSCWADKEDLRRHLRASFRRKKNAVKP